MPNAHTANFIRYAEQGRQQRLRNRVATALYQEVYSSDSTLYDYATHYSYDIHGNVKELVQDNPALKNAGQQYKKLVYEYDLISGNVNKVIYQPDMADQLFHKYEYDADNRIRKVYTSLDGFNWDRDADYKYYRHGPLARTEIGDLNIQGIDYAYTLQGWIKGVNSNELSIEKDMGGDGENDFSQDAFGYSLHYNTNDYKAIGGSEAFLSAVSSGTVTNLYNGNISRMATAITENVTGGSDLNLGTQVRDFTYDELNRLISSNKVSGKGNDNAYATAYNYDANGNIKRLTRHDGNAEGMDDLTYHYVKDGNGNLISNRLLHVNDDVHGNELTADIKDQRRDYAQNNSETHNYKYDKLGNLIADEQEEIAEIKWNVQGKVQEINRTANSTKSDLLFKYDAMGNRVSKTEIFPEDKPGPFGEKEITTYYVRDAQGNVMAVYNEQKYEDGKIDLSLTEQHLYGSSRLGMRQVNELLVEKDEIKEFEPEYSSRNLGEKVFELTNHLGNVLAVVSDKKLANNEPDVKATFDYFPFGSPMPGRVNEREEYRYGFTGHEKENEVTAGIYSTETRLLDTRLGIWRGVDELFMKYPDLSSYNYVVNNPITFVDFDGREISYSYEYEKDKDGKEIQDKNGNKNITGVTMNFVGKIINNSGDNINMDRAAKDIASDIKTAFSGDVEIGGKTIPMQVNVELLPVSSMTEVSDNDHLFVLVNGYGKVGGGVNMMGGKVMNIYAGDYANDNMFSNNLSWNSTRSAVHEFGHAAGLTHGSASGWRNLMRQGGGGINVTPLQRGYLLRNQNNINKGVNSYGGRPYPYMHYYERGVEYVIPVYKVFNMGK